MRAKGILVIITLLIIAFLALPTGATLNTIASGGFKGFVDNISFNLLGYDQTRLEISTPEPEITQTSEAELGSQELLEREFSWKYRGKVWTYQLKIPKGVYDYYANLKRPPTNDYSVFVTDPVDDAYISAIAARFTEVARQEGYSTKQTVEFVVSFVQNIKYASDEDTKGVPQFARYPVETLVEQRGDCEDTSILLAAILKEMNFGVVLVMLSGDPGHMAVGVKGEGLTGVYYEFQGNKYYYVETTDVGWSIGQIPDEYRHWEAVILPLIPQPVITHQWSSRVTWNGQVELIVTVHNDGTAAALDTKVYAALDAGGDQVYDQQWSKPLDLPPRSSGTYTLRLKAPPGSETRIIVKIVSSGTQYDESKSDYFSP